MLRVIPIEVSARHVHLSPKDLRALFGKGYELRKERKLTQPGEFAAEEKVDIEADSRKIANVRVIGPTRRETQIELSQTDAIFLRINAPLRDSEALRDTPGVSLIGPVGKIQLKRGVINTWRHIHCNTREAKKLRVKDGNLVSVKTRGESAVTFHNVRVRVSSNSHLCLHIDTDEGNAAKIRTSGEGLLIKKDSKKRHDFGLELR